MSDMSIYNVSVQLQDLMARRADLTSELVCSPEQRDANTAALEVLDKEITAFLHSELVRDKIDGVAGYLRLCPARGKEARAEAARLIAYADSIEGRAEHLKSVLLKIMDAAGQPRLEGRNSIIRKQANGGKVPVVVSASSLLPENMVTYEGRLSGEAYAALRALVPSWLERHDVLLERKPHLGRIGAELDTACGMCEGKGGYVERSPSRMSAEALESGAAQEVVSCNACGGTGKNSVPGAYLGERQSHVRVA